MKMKMKIFSAIPGSAGWQHFEKDINKFLEDPALETLSVTVSSAGGELHVCILYKGK